MRKYVIFLIILLFFGIQKVEAKTIDVNLSDTMTIAAYDLPEFGFGEYGQTCYELVGENLSKVIKLFVNGIQLVAAIIALVNGILIVMPVLIAKDAGALNKAIAKCIKMGIVLLVIGVFPTLVSVCGKLFGYDLTCIF